MAGHKLQSKHLEQANAQLPKVLVAGEIAWTHGTTYIYQGKPGAMNQAALSLSR